MLENIADGAPLQVEVVRGHDLFELEAPASRKSGVDDWAEQIKLGVELGELAAGIEYDRGVEIASVDPDGPAASLVRIGDRIVELKTPKVDYRTIHRATELENALNDVRAEESITLTILRGYEQLAQIVVLGARHSQEFL